MFPAVFRSWVSGLKEGRINKSHVWWHHSSYCIHVCHCLWVTTTVNKTIMFPFEHSWLIWSCVFRLPKLHLFDKTFFFFTHQRPSWAPPGGEWTVCLEAALSASWPPRSVGSLRYSGRWWPRCDPRHTRSSAGLWCCLLLSSKREKRNCNISQRFPVSPPLAHLDEGISGPIVGDSEA